MPTSEFDYSTNPFWVMLETIKAFVSEHDSVVLSDDDPFQRMIGFSADGEHKWRMGLKELKFSFMAENDPEGRLSFYREHMMTATGRRLLADQLTAGVAP